MANPALLDKTTKTLAADSTCTSVMTRRGVLESLGVFVAIMFISGAIGWGVMASRLNSPSIGLLMWVPLLAAFALSFVIMRHPRTAKWLGAVYALLEGFILGGISAWYNVQYHGIVGEAIGSTLGVALVVWFLYGSGLVKVTNKTYRVVLFATMGAMAFYAVSIVSMLFGGPNLDGSSGVVGIVVSLVLAALAAANLLIDFDRVDKMIAVGVEAEYEWYMAFAMVLAIVWLYLEILNVLGKMRR